LELQESFPIQRFSLWGESRDSDKSFLGIPVKSTVQMSIPPRRLPRVRDRHHALSRHLAIQDHPTLRVRAPTVHACVRVEFVRLTGVRDPRQRDDLACGVIK